MNLPSQHIAYDINEINATREIAELLLNATIASGRQFKSGHPDLNPPCLNPPRLNPPRLNPPCLRLSRLTRSCSRHMSDKPAQEQMGRG